MTPCTTPPGTTPGTACGPPAVDAVDDRAVVPSRDHARDRRALWEPGDSTVDGDRAADLGGRSVVHNPQPLLLLLVRYTSRLTAEKASDGVKFRCERDVLVEALGTAGRATASRGGALPVLAGVQAELPGDTLTLTGSDLELTISVESARASSGVSDGVAVLPARLVSDVVRALPPGAVEVEVDGERGPHHRRAARSSRCGCSRPTSSPGSPEPAGDAVTLDAGELAAALRQVVPAASSDDARPILTGVLVAAEADGLRLVATDSYRLAVRDLPGQSVLAEGQTVLVPSRALNELTRVLAGVDELTLRLGERDASFEAGAVRLTTRLIEGEFPNYRGPDPASPPQPADRQPGGAARGRAPGQAAGRGRRRRCAWR